MDNGGDILQLCRLCLVKDDVNIPIFEEHGDIRQILQKISSCLPVKVSGEDKLPKKICDGCSYKLDMFYEFWNTTANSEKQLLKWLGEAEMNSKATDGTAPTVAQPLKPAETVVKQEAIDPSDIHTEENDDDKTYMFQQKFSTEEAASAPAASNEEPPPPKRARRTAAVKAQIAMDPESDDDEDSGEAITKIEDESEDSEGDDHEPSFVDVPSTSADDQPGPSGVGKDGGDAPYAKQVTSSVVLDEKKGNNHFTDNNKNTKLKCCHLCGKLFKDTRRLRRHLTSHSEERPFACNLCDRKFKRKQEVSAHIRVHDSSMSFECDFCSKKLRSKGSWLTHRKRHLKDYVAKCDACCQGFVTKQEYNNHMGSRHGESKNVCNICGRAFYDKSTLQGHMARHAKNYENNRNIICKLCNKTFLQERYLKHHFRRIHKNGGQKFVCDYCGKKICSKKSLHDHLLLHKGLKPIECKECGKNFVLMTTLKQHMRTHTGDRPYECHQCGKCFTQRSPLTIHMRYHTGERPYICNVCSDRFVSKGTLSVHRRNKHNSV